MADDITLKVPGDRELPKQTLHDGVIVDFIDLGVEEKDWGNGLESKRLCQYVVELATHRTDGKHFNVRTKKFNATMGEKASLEKFAASVIGAPFTSETRKAFKAKSLVGRSVQTFIKHNTGSNGKVYANMEAVVPGGDFKGSGKYVRWVPKNDTKPAAPATVAEEQIPF
jgi:hypothetical protein